MYNHRIAQLHRTRPQRRTSSASSAEQPTIDSNALSAKRKEPSEYTSSTPTACLPSPKMSGDFQVLKDGVEQQRSQVREGRLTLASSLDRLGEHHLRQKEYDEAMDAFTEALHEKRSIISHMRLASGMSGGSSFCSTIFDGDVDCSPELHDRTIDEIITTLRNMGNVHSLRGEQDEAMRYYTEVTNLRATKAALRADSGDDTTTLLSGLNNGGDEDNSTLMSEINEDVKALDDMFRSISFRSRDQSSSLWNTPRKASKPLVSHENSAGINPSSKRRKGNSVERSLSSIESEPFKRFSSIGFPATGNEISEALELYKTVLEIYKGPNLESHKDSFNSMALRVDLLEDTQKRSDSKSPKDAGAVDLELAVEIYQQILTAQNEMNTTQQQLDPEVEPQSCSGIASTLIRMGSLYYKLGNRLEELRMYKEAKSFYKRAFGENHSFVAGTRKNIGMVLAERGEYEEAMEQFEKARKIYLAVNVDETNRDVASAISCMGNVKNRLGELDDALKHYMEALHIHKAHQDGAVGPDSNATAIRDVTSTLKVIGMVHAKKGDLDKAMDFFTEAMTLLRSSGVDNTPSGRETTSSILTRMASIYVKKGDLEQAMDHYREAYELTVRNRGTTNHQEVAGILHYIGGIFHKRSDYDEAMNCYQEAIRIYHGTLGPGNPTVAGTLVMVGSIHYKRRNLDSAMMFYREALRLNRDAYGLHHPDVGPILKSIGTIMTKKGEYHDAYDVFRDVLSIKCTVHGTGHPEVASAYKSLGNVHYKLGELADAERQYRHALSIYRRTRGESHPDTIAARTTIEHIRYWMKERGQRKLEERHTRNSSRVVADDDDERSC